MNHITQAFGQPTNNLQCTADEFYMLKEFLKPLGVQLRMCSSSMEGGASVVIVEARNTWKAASELSQSREWATNFVKSLLQGNWCN